MMPVRFQVVGVLWIVSLMLLPAESSAQVSDEAAVYRGWTVSDVLIEGLEAELARDLKL